MVKKELKKMIDCIDQASRFRQTVVLTSSILHNLKPLILPHITSPHPFSLPGVFPYLTYDPSPVHSGVVLHGLTDPPEISIMILFFLFPSSYQLRVVPLQSFTQYFHNETSFSACGVLVWFFVSLICLLIRFVSLCALFITLFVIIPFALKSFFI